MCYTRLEQQILRKWQEEEEEEEEEEEGLKCRV
jgi:hypothetical protein